MEFHSRKYSLYDIYKWHNDEILTLNPYYQRRRNIWSSAGKSYFLDTLFRNLPSHKIFLREFVKKGRGIREVVDGQQRLRTIIDFLDGKFRINNSKELCNRGLKFDDLDDESKHSFMNYEISIDILLEASDADVRDLFLRLNTYTIRLNKQELRNAKYHGEFKQFINMLSEKTISRLLNLKVISKRSFTRMMELELISEIIIAMMDGLQDKKKFIDHFYERYDEKFPDQNIYESQFLDLFDLIYKTHYNAIKRTVFRRKALFYSLFLALYDLKYGLKHQDGPYTDKIDHEKINNTIYKLNSIIKNKDVPNEYNDFIEASSRQTDNINPRIKRHNTILFDILNSVRQ